MANDKEASPFLGGFSTSVYQTSGHDHSNWGEWCRQHNWFGGHTIQGDQQCGVSCEFWNLYELDIANAASLGANAFRLSLEWSRFEPLMGYTDPIAVQRYHAILDCLEKHQLEPILTLHHFVHPTWFEHLGGFLNAENVHYFVQFAKQAYRTFGHRVRLWVTFNEPALASFAGFITGIFPPGKILNFQSCATNLVHMLQAHAQAYDAMKALAGDDASEIGIVHNFFWFEERKGGWFRPWYTKNLCKYLNDLWGNDLVLQFLKTGNYASKPFWWLPGIYYSSPDGRPGCDFVGINYYSRAVLDWRLNPTCQPGETMTDMPYGLYPPGIRKALEFFKPLGVPLYLTEIGVADKGDSVRRELIETYLPEVEKAIHDGHNVKGVFYWSLTDNFEWQEGFNMKFGIYAWEDDGTQRRTLRSAGHLLSKWLERLRSMNVSYSYSKTA